MLVTVVPFFLVAPVLGQETVKPQGEKVAEKAKPTVTFYYFDK